MPPPISQAERTFILNQLGVQAAATVSQLWDAAARFEDVDFFRFVADAFPEVALGYHQIAAEYAASWFEYDFPTIRADAKLADPPPVEKLVASAEWALGGDGRQALDRMNATMQRTIYDGDRDTTVANAEANGMRWIRQARPNACAFCRLLATRTTLSDDLYRSEEAALGVVGRSVNLSIADRRMIASGQMTREEALARRDEMQRTYQIGSRRGTARTKSLRGVRKFGDKYHDDCRCTAKAIPVGVDPMAVLYEEEPEYAEAVEAWNREYIKARSGVTDADRPATVNNILSEWRTFGDDIA